MTAPDSTSVAGTIKQRGDRNCPVCRGIGVRDCSGSIIYDENGKVRHSSSATTICGCAAPANATDTAGLVATLRARDLFHEAEAFVSQAAALTALRAENERLQAELARVRQYAGHRRWCDMMSAFTDGKKCICGWTVAALSDAQKETEA